MRSSEAQIYTTPAQIATYFLRHFGALCALHRRSGSSSFTPTLPDARVPQTCGTTTLRDTLGHAPPPAARVPLSPQTDRPPAWPVQRTGQCQTGRSDSRSPGSGLARLFISPSQMAFQVLRASDKPRGVRPCNTWVLRGLQPPRTVAVGMGWFPVHVDTNQQRQYGDNRRRSTTGQRRVPSTSAVPGNRNRRMLDQH